MNLESFNERLASIRDTFFWKAQALQQIANFHTLVAEFAKSHSIAVDVVATHRSKSIELPVVRLASQKGIILLRANFYNITVCVMFNEAPSIDPEALFPVMPWDHYVAVIDRCRNYSWRGWSDEDMDNPRLLAYEGSPGHYQTKPLDEKLRWTRRMTDPAWYTHDWSSAVLHPLGTMPGCRFIRLDTAGLEGMSEVAPSDALKVWEPGARAFTFVTDWDRVTDQLAHLLS